MTARLDPDSALAEFLRKEDDMNLSTQSRAHAEQQAQLAAAQAQARIAIKQLQLNVALQALAITDKAPISRDLIDKANETLLASLSDEFYLLPGSES
jgi:hypothetical protein